MAASLLLITPPFTQLNTPYPATAYLKGFLNTQGIASTQADLGIEVTLQLFSKATLVQVFAEAKLSINGQEPNANIQRILALETHYLSTIDAVIAFLQGKNPTLAFSIAQRNFLPEASRFAQLQDLQYAFGTMGVQDQAKYIATLYLEDIADLITTCVDERFGFSRYAEKLARSAHSFEPIEKALQQPLTLIENILIEKLQIHLQQHQPSAVALSVPFPGNLMGALRCGQFIKANYPAIKVIMGGGFPNTELRSLQDATIFKYIDFITLDDGETPIIQLCKYLEGEATVADLKRTYLLQNQELVFINNPACTDIKQAQVGTPDYYGLPLAEYINAIEIVNPMHRLWSDGRWNKLTMAHGCYWGKCTFCDTTLPYIKHYEPLTAAILVNRMEEIIAQTGVTGFHFVDEAAPPVLMKSVALEIIKRKLVVTWWANIRFEKSFTRDTCLLLKESGLIGVSGGLEVASDRLLALINKGITVAQVAKVNKHFTQAGIMVHAYLMYGFPTQTNQETIDSLEMVRQMFALGVLQSAFWHLFTMTAHSPVGLDPEKFKVEKVQEHPILFAENDVEHIDTTGGEHEIFAFGLKKSLFNYMQGIGLQEPLHKWFEHKVPKTSIPPNYIENLLLQPDTDVAKPTHKVSWLGTTLPSTQEVQTKKGMSRTMLKIPLLHKKTSLEILVPEAQGQWLLQLLPRLVPGMQALLSVADIEANYNEAGLEYFDLFWFNKPINQLHKVGLLHW